MPSLFVIQGRDQGTRFELDGSSVGVGRDSSNAIQVHDTEVSRRHAELRCDDGSYVWADLGSSNGTYVNGRRVQEHPLASGDRVQIGGTLMLFTNPAEGEDDLSSKIDIITGAAREDGSRIVRSIGQAEGSRLFGGGDADSPWLARARGNLQVMYRTALAVSHTLDIDQLLSRILELIFEWVEVDRGCIMLVDPQSKQLVPKVHRHRKGHESAERISISQSILDFVREHNEGVLTSDAREDQRWDHTASILQAGVREAICVPMQGRYDVVGVIYIDTRTSPQRLVQQGGTTFKDDHLKLMIAIAHQAALAVEDTRYYSAMVQAERLAAVGQTIAMLSHHIKNILQGIRGGSYLIDMGLSQHDEAVTRKGWSMVERNQNKISALVMDMLTYSKDREPEFIPGDLNATVGEVVELLQARAGELHAAIEWRPVADLPTIRFDPEAMHRAVLNVVGNALDACEAKEEGERRVQVYTEFQPDPPLARIVVADTGVGIDPEDLERIFTIFVSKKGNRGTGLGLPVSQKILKEHGGDIRAESEVGVGSRFTLELPAAPCDSDAGEPSPLSETGETGHI